jgi:hypothetical protein
MKMSYGLKNLHKFVALVGAVVVTVGVQFALLSGFEQMAIDAQTAASISQTAGSVPGAGSVS